MKYILFIFFLVAAQITSFAQVDNSGKSNASSKDITEKGLFKISVMYPSTEGATFNMAYYETHHMPMVAAFIGSNLIRYTIEKVVSSGVPNQPLPYIAIGTFYVKSVDDYRAAIAPNRDAIRADFANYTNVTPIILVSEVVR